MNNWEQLGNTTYQRRGLDMYRYTGETASYIRSVILRKVKYDDGKDRYFLYIKSKPPLFNLYRYHTNPETLYGYDQTGSIPFRNELSDINGHDAMEYILDRDNIQESLFQAVEKDFGIEVVEHTIDNFQNNNDGSKTISYWLNRW